jgi:hypothetical protein
MGLGEEVEVHGKFLEITFNETALIEFVAVLKNGV